jgi:GT2 family glycosyltransferase
MNARPTPSAVLEELRKSHPLLSLGVEQRGALLGLYKYARTMGRVRLGMSVATWAFQRDPLDHDNALVLLDASAAAANVSGVAAPAPALLGLARSVQSALNAPPDPQLEEVLTSGDIKYLARHVAPRLSDPSQAFRVLARSWDSLLKGGAMDLPRSLLASAAFPEELLPLKPRLLAQWAVQYAARDTDVIGACDDELWGAWKRAAQAALLDTLDDSDAAPAWLDVWREMPWHVNAGLMAHASANVIRPDLSRSGDSVILLYSWNKSALLEQTLDSLYSTDLGAARLVVLDNGSTDRMPEVLEAAKQRFGADRFDHVRLPVNIGAPGARNWLLSLPTVRRSKYAVFCDDDVFLPTDWLGRLLVSVPGDGKFGAVGCRIAAADKPHGLQSADYNMYPPDFSEGGTRLGMFDNCAGQLDSGMFGYTRPCLSVSGCCHLLNMEAVDCAGAFDIRYNPTQFDDLDRDLRSCLAGYPSVYAGSLRVRHMQHSSLAKAAGQASVGNVLGNRMKLEIRFDDHELERLFHLSQEMLWSDLLEKARELEEM